MTRSNRWAACGLAWAIGAGAPADVLYLNDGRIFEGQTTRDEQGAVSIDTMIGRIRTTLRFARAEVNRIEERPLPLDFYEAALSDASQAHLDLERAPAPTRDGATYYLEVPIRGVFGHDVLPRAIEDSLEFAVRRKIEHVVFVIDSPGGDVWAADAIAELLERFSDHVTCYAVVERAVSAAIWVAFSCERIYVTPSSAMGAAVVFDRDETTGDAAVDGKITSAYAAILGGIAERHGRSASIARAMVDPLAELYSYLDEHGERHFAPAPPDEGEFETIDSALNVLTLTGDEMLRLGIADGRAHSSFDIGERIGLPGWKEPIAFGSATAQRYTVLARKAREAIADSERSISDAIRRAEQRHPEKGSYGFNSRGEFTKFGKEQWLRRVDECASLWDEVISASNRLGRALTAAQEIGLQLDFARLRELQAASKDEASRQRDHLRVLRARTGR